MSVSEPHDVTPPIKRRRHPKTNRGPTLHDVARAAAVSTASVSRALSHPDLVSEEVCERVMAAVSGLGYVPNAAARALSGRPSRTVGAVVSTLDDPPTRLALEGLTLGLAAYGAPVLLAIAGDATTVPDCVRALVACGAEGVAYLGGAVPGNLVAGRRVVSGSFDDSAPDIATVGSGFDCAGALALGARYLHSLGHVQVGLIGSNERRAVALRNALANTGIEIVDDSAGVMAGDGIGGLFDRWRMLRAPPTAALCASDALAVTVLQECKRRDIAVPEQFAVVGFGDTEVSRMTRPALSTLRIPAREAGRALARALLDALDGKRAPSPAQVPKLLAKVVARASTGLKRA